MKETNMSRTNILCWIKQNLKDAKKIAVEKNFLDEVTTEIFQLCDTLIRVRKFEVDFVINDSVVSVPFHRIFGIDKVGANSYTFFICYTINEETQYVTKIHIYNTGRVIVDM